MTAPQPTAALTRSDGLRGAAFRIGKMIPLPFVRHPRRQDEAVGIFGFAAHRSTARALRRAASRTVKQRRAQRQLRPPSLLSFTLCPCRGGLFAEQALPVSPVENIIMTAELVKDRLNAIPLCRVNIKFKCVTPNVQQLRFVRFKL